MLSWYHFSYDTHEKNILKGVLFFLLKTQDIGMRLLADDEKKNWFCIDIFLNRNDERQVLSPTVYPIQLQYLFFLVSTFSYTLSEVWKFALSLMCSGIEWFAFGVIIKAPIIKSPLRKTFCISFCSLLCCFLINSDRRRVMILRISLFCRQLWSIECKFYSFCRI